MNFLNPFSNPIFYQVMLRTIGVFLAGFILILILNKFKLKNIWKTNIGQRYLSWLFIGPIYIITILLGENPGMFILISILILAIWEVSKITKLPKEHIIALYFMSIVSIFVATKYSMFFYSLPLFYYLVLSFVAIKRNDAKKGLFNTALAMYISIWIIFSLSHFVLLGDLNTQIDTTRSLLLLIGFAVPLSDIFAYIVGKFFNKINFLDKYKIASNLSPKKTYIGTLGNIIGAGLGIGIMFFAIKTYLPWYHWIILSILIGVMGVYGDIIESMFKRYFKVKDSSKLIPGHGGILDRIDSVLRVIVIVYYYLLFFL